VFIILMILITVISNQTSSLKNPPRIPHWMASLPELFDSAAAFLREHSPITIVSHIDADGICATAILEEALDETGVGFSARFVAQASAMAFQRVAQETTGAVAFVDLGSSHLDTISEAFAGRPVLIVDHHQAQGAAPDALLCSPVAAGLDGTRVVSAAGLALRVAELIAPGVAKDMAPIAIVGAHADNQEPFATINAAILDDCVARGQVRVRSGARLYGIETKRVLDLVAYSYDLRIEGVTRDARGAKRLLDGLRIRDPERRRWKDLSDDEQDALDAELLRLSPNPDARVTHYTIPSMPPGPLRDTREAATLLNACGRLGQPDVAVMALRGDLGALRDAERVQREYRRAVQDAHRWFQDARARGDGDVVVRGELVLIRARDHVPPDITGTLCSVLTRGEEVPRGTVVVCVARNADGTGTTKASARAVDSHADLARVLRDAAAAVGGEGGGHSMAAGAVIPTDAEEEFLRLVQDSLE